MMFKQLTLIFFSLANLVNSVSIHKEYKPDLVMGLSTIECSENQKVDPKPQGTVRIAMIGDATTVGAGTQRQNQSFEYDNHLQMDGSKVGFQGYPYLLNQLLKNHNSTQKYEIINFASDDFSLYHNVEGKTYKDLCEYSQLISSEPDIVISMIGAKESMDEEHFKPDGFVQTYNGFVKDIQNISSHPQMILVSPIYTGSSVMYLTQKEPAPTWQYADKDIAYLVTKVAELSNITTDQYVDSEKLMKFENNNTMLSERNPNEHGYGILAQELYMRLAYSPKIKNLITQKFEPNQSLHEKNDDKLGHQQAKVENKLKIELSEKCYDQAYRNGKEAFFPGEKFNFQIPAPKMGNEIRIAIGGDSVTQGCCGTTMGQIEALPKYNRLTDLTDGSQQGLMGWPYLLHSLLKNNNQTIDYTMMNFGVAATSIIPGAKHRSFYNDCRYEQLMKSMPNVVFYAFGAMDTHLKNYTADKFVESYVKLIKETQNLPTKPLVFLMTPTFNCKNKLKPVPEQAADMIFETSLCSPDQDVQGLIQKVASQTEIPHDHIVDAWSIIMDNKEKNLGGDLMHPNAHGMGDIAQEFFMKMALSPLYQARQNKVVKGFDKSFLSAVQSEHKKQLIQ